jgi:hypothetical protein
MCGNPRKFWKNSKYSRVKICEYRRGHYTAEEMLDEIESR